MPKNIEDIIVPERKRSIRNIPIPEGHRRNNGNDTSFTFREHHSSEVPRDVSDTPRKRSTKTWLGKKNIWIATGVALLVLIFAILSVFNGATLAYIPKSQALSFNNDVYTAEKSGEGKLFYSVVKLAGDKGLEVSASGEKEASRKASGTIVVYNNTSSESQRLVENTRFETPSGLIYRIPNAIMIPGKRTVSGMSQPGSIETIVYADEAGDKYNISLTDFTVPGFKGSARFSTIYARSKTEMSGGFVGTEKVVTDQETARAKTELETALRDELISTAKAQVPEDFILLPSLSFVTFKDLPQTNSTNKDKVTINMNGNLYGIMFKKSDLSTHLTLKKITLVPGESVDVITPDSLSFSFVNTSSADLLLSDKISFSVTGEAMAVWRTDEVALKADLIGKHKREIPSILHNYPTVLSATATIRPFWKSSFPNDSARISIKKLPIN